MTQQELKEQLKTKFNIEADNCFPKKSYLRDGEPTVGLFKHELEKDFFFINEYNGKAYKLDVKNKIHELNYPKEEFMGKDKYQVPVKDFKELELPKEFKEQEDANFHELTVRDLAAILLKKPVSNKIWLNKLIED